MSKCIYCNKTLETKADEYGKYPSYVLCQSCFLGIDVDDQYVLDEFVRNGYTHEDIKGMFELGSENKFKILIDTLKEE